MLASLPPKTESRRLRFLEVGAGIGTMIERLLEGSVLGQDGYIALESEGAHRPVLDPGSALHPVRAALDGPHDPGALRAEQEAEHVGVVG